MKEKIVIFIVGLLLGAIISTGSIYIYTVANNSNNNDQKNEINDGNIPNMAPGENGGPGEPPSLPNGNDPRNNSNLNSN